MFCPNCGAQIPDGSKFCTSCGSVLGASAPSADETQAQPTRVAPRPAPQPTYQPTSPAAPSPDQQLTPAPQPPKKSGRGKVVAIVVLALLLVAAIAVIVWQVVLPRLGSDQQPAEQPAQEQQAEPESDTDPDLKPEVTAPEAPELEAPELTVPESTTPSQGATLEDYLNASGQYDAVCDAMTESLTQSGGDAVADAGTQVKDNAIEVHVAWNFSSSDANAQAIEDNMIETYNSSSVVDVMASSVEQLESASGISGITIELYLYTTEYDQFGTVAYGADGLVTGGGASFGGEPLVS